jgi:glycosyltransferase involved in cell wall biosynthesis
MFKQMVEELVSIIIPTYKRAERLSNAINSLLEQTYKHIEIIVVDDNNPHTEYRKNTENIMKRYKDKPNVLYIKHEKNKNGAAARNTGIKACKGKYICFLDDDDIYFPEKIKIQLNYLKNNIEHNGVYCGRIEKGREVIGTISGDLSKEILSLSFTPTTPALMFRGEVINSIGGFDESFKRHQDFELLLRYFRDNSLGVIPEPLVEIGQNEGENELHGEILEKNKEFFLGLFKDEIDRIDNIEKGFKKSVYIAHYVPIFWDHISQINLLRALKIYMKGIKFSYFKFNKGIINYFFKYLRFLFTKERVMN